MIYDDDYAGNGALNDLDGSNATLSDEQRVQRVIDAINNIGTVTLDSENDILKAENLYNKLSSELKANISNEVYSILTKARDTYEQLVEEKENQNNNNNNPTAQGSVAKFSFGADDSPTHKDNNSALETYTETNGNYTFTYTNGYKAFPGSVDAKGNSCLKLGTSKEIGSFKFTVPSDVNKVFIYVAQYKTNNTTLSVNGKQYTISTASNNGEYTAIEIDTTSTKTIEVATVSGANRCMINTIEFCK